MGCRHFNRISLTYYYVRIKIVISSISPIDVAYQLSFYPQVYSPSPKDTKISLIRKICCILQLFARQVIMITIMDQVQQLTTSLSLVFMPNDFDSPSSCHKFHHITYSLLVMSPYHIYFHTSIVNTVLQKKKKGEERPFY